MSKKISFKYKGFEIRVRKLNEFYCEREGVQALVRYEFDTFHAYEFNGEQYLIDFVKHIGGEWINKPKTRPIESVEGRIY